MANNQLPDNVTISQLIRDEGDLYRRQPRIDPTKLSYNFEQYKRYTKLLGEAKVKDDDEQKSFYKMVKYVKDNQSNLKDAHVRELILRKGIDPNLIEIPPEFEQLTYEQGDELNKFGRKVAKRKYINIKNSRSQLHYDAWRCSDRSMPKGGGTQHCVAKLMLPPADLVKLFGTPDSTEIFYMGSGQYTFEDTNLDAYCIFDYKQTDYYHGINREDEYYTTKKNLSKPLHTRKRKYPSIEEFWTSTEP